jgi:hypothetical protein
MDNIFVEGDPRKPVFEALCQSMPQVSRPEWIEKRVARGDEQVNLIWSRYILDKDRNVIPVPDHVFYAWSFVTEDDTYIVAKTMVKETEVSTCFVPMHMPKHGFPNKPVVFETMVFRSDGRNQTYNRYHTWQEAEQGHRDAVALINSESTHNK